MMTRESDPILMCTLLDLDQGILHSYIQNRTDKHISTMDFQWPGHDPPENCHLTVKKLTKT